VSERRACEALVVDRSSGQALLAYTRARLASQGVPYQPSIATAISSRSIIFPAQRKRRTIEVSVGDCPSPPTPHDRGPQTTLTASVWRAFAFGYSRLNLVSVSGWGTVGPWGILRFALARALSHAGHAPD
jgi:hypothetical protein